MQIPEPGAGAIWGESLWMAGSYFQLDPDLETQHTIGSLHDLGVGVGVVLPCGCLTSQQGASSPRASHWACL